MRKYSATSAHGEVFTLSPWGWERFRDFMAQVSPVDELEAWSHVRFTRLEYGRVRVERFYGETVK